MTTKPHIRASALDHYPDCNRRGIAKAFRHIIEEHGYQLRQPTIGIYAPIGTAAHAAAEHSYKTKMQTGGDPGSLEDAIEVGIEKFRMEIENGFEPDNLTKTPNEGEHQIQAIVRAHFHIVLPGILPIEIEPDLKADAGKYLLTGHPDVVVIDGVNDLKTGASANTYHAQLGAYSLLCKSNKLTNPQKLTLDWLPRSAKNKPVVHKRYEYDVVLCEKIAVRTAAQIYSDLNNFLQSGDPSVIQANPRSQTCGPKYCPAWGTDWCPVTKTHSA